MTVIFSHRPTHEWGRSTIAGTESDTILQALYLVTQFLRKCHNTQPFISRISLRTVRSSLVKAVNGGRTALKIGEQ